MMRRFVSVEALFNGRHFDRQIIILCVSWYTCFKLSFRDLVIIMAERGISLAHTTILRWVQHYLPEFEKRCKRYARPGGGSYKGPRTMGLAIPGGRQVRPNGRFLLESKAM
jgi:transposase-like protein